jgi:hypothetical protein
MSLQWERLCPLPRKWRFRIESTILVSGRMSQYVPPTLTIRNPIIWTQNVFVCPVWFSKPTAFISPNSINRLVSVVRAKCVVCDVKTEFSNIFQRSMLLIRPSRYKFINVKTFSQVAPKLLPQIMPLNQKTKIPPLLSTSDRSTCHLTLLDLLYSLRRFVVLAT